METDLKVQYIEADDTYVDRLVQERCNSIANTLELHLSCINLLIYA